MEYKHNESYFLGKKVGDMFNNCLECELHLSGLLFYLWDSHMVLATLVSLVSFFTVRELESCALFQSFFTRDHCTLQWVAEFHQDPVGVPGAPSIPRYSLGGSSPKPALQMALCPLNSFSCPGRSWSSLSKELQSSLFALKYLVNHNTLYYYKMQYSTWH